LKRHSETARHNTAEWWIRSAAHWQPSLLNVVARLCSALRVQCHRSVSCPTMPHVIIIY